MVTREDVVKWARKMHFDGAVVVDTEATGGAFQDEIFEIAGLDWQRVGLAGFDQHASGRPQERQFRADVFERNAKTVRAQIQKRHTLIFHKCMDGAERFGEQLHFQMESFDKTAAAAMGAEEEVRAALLHLAPVSQRAV